MGSEALNLMKEFKTLHYTEFKWGQVENEDKQIGQSQTHSHSY